MRIFITGASGCIGHYIVDQLIHETNHELFLLVRNPDKFRLDVSHLPRIHLIQGDLKQIQAHQSLLFTMEMVILTAAAWGGEEETYEINVTKTQTLIDSLNPAICQQIIYFSTESILGRTNQLLPQAAEIGTDYVRTKSLCLQNLSQHPLQDRITALFPTLVFGGDGRKPYSHISKHLPDEIRWINLAKWFRIDSSFHLVHAQDIATVVGYFINHPPQAPSMRKFVLGNPPQTADQLIEEVCTYFNKTIWFRLPLTAGFANFLIKLLRLEMAPWDRFCMSHRHFIHDEAVNPATFNLPVYCATVADILRSRGIPRRSSPKLDVPKPVG